MKLRNQKVAAMKPTRLTGKEWSKLVFIAFYPKSPHSKKLLSVLSGNAREIGLTLLNGARRVADKHIDELAEFLQRFAAEIKRQTQKRKQIVEIRRLKMRIEELEHTLRWR